MVCVDENSRNMKSDHNNSFTDVLPYLKSFSRFFQQYQSIIFIAFIILGTGLMILMLFVLIVVLIQTRRQKTNSLRSIRSDGQFSNRENFLLNCIIVTL